MLSKLAAPAALSLMAAGCATSGPPPLPILAYAGADCSVAPDLSAAVSLTPDKDKRIWNVDRPLTATAPCLTRAGASVPYMVLALPPAGSARMVEVGALLEGARIFSPAVSLLDASGAETRSFAPDQYMVRTGLLSVQFVPTAQERFVLVAADPARVGQSYDSIHTGTSSTYVPVGAYGTSWRSGHEAAVSRGFSYEGMLRANVYRPEEPKG